MFEEIIIKPNKKQNIIQVYPKENLFEKLKNLKEYKKYIEFIIKEKRSN